MRTSRRTLFAPAVAAVAAASLLLGGCTGGESDDASLTPEEVLAEAKTQLDETPGVRVVLETEKLPDGVDGVVRADGVGAHPPAFEGTLKVAASGLNLDVDVVAVDGVVYAKLPFTTKFVEIDPEDYTAPDPAVLLDSEGGLSSLLTAAKDVEEGDPVRSGEQVLTTYSGTVPGAAVASVIPSADASADFDATFTLSDENRLTEAEITGPFYPDAAAVTYTVTFDGYGTAVDITAP